MPVATQPPVKTQFASFELQVLDADDGDKRPLPGLRVRVDLLDEAGKTAIHRT